MQIRLTVNGEHKELQVEPNESLLRILRRHGYFGVKHGCETGDCGSCTILLDGRPVTSCTLRPADADGHALTTIEGIGTRSNLHPLQRAFVEAGAIQCGYCTPGMILSAKALLETNPAPTEKEVREALKGVLCRCTGYVKPVQAVLLAAARMRGEDPPLPTPCAETIPISPDRDIDLSSPQDEPLGEIPWNGGTGLAVQAPPRIRAAQPGSAPEHWRVVGRPEVKVDAIKLALGKPAFADDLELRGMLHAKILHSPVAHAKIKNIDVSKAQRLPGVRCVLTYRDLPRVVYSTAGQSDPIPGPLDTFSLDSKVRFVGDRVALVAADSVEIAESALRLIEVEYQPLPAVLDPRDSLKEDAPVLHDESEYVPFGQSDPLHNIAAAIRIDIGDVEAGFRHADFIFEDEYLVPKVQQASIEPHVAITWWDEDDRLVIRTSTQVPFHVRRILAPVLGLQDKQIRVIKPRIGGGFGGKQEVLIEDAAA
ncbi:MAG TPA: 2Fe-2S iron-sulfur cluster-binding protein, partial [Acidobacteriota bacterium]|nr:2Fe-2S iron-sulfur cluster-binding protein [Acidobacteriota bacterium]